MKGSPLIDYLKSHLTIMKLLAMDVNKRKKSYTKQVYSRNQKTEYYVSKLLRTQTKDGAVSLF